MNNDTNCIIVHGCPSNDEAKDPSKRTYDKHWIPWVKEKLISNGIPTETPLMPEPWFPVYENFKKEFDKQNINENTVLIGHSCGCAFLVRWLGESKRKIKQLILVAPWKKNDLGDEYREKFYTYEIDPSIKNQVGQITMFTSDNEEELGKESLEIFHNVLGGKIIELPKHGHYTQNDMGTVEFPELLASVK